VLILASPPRATGVLGPTYWFANNFSGRELGGLERKDHPAWRGMEQGRVVEAGRAI